MKHCIIVLQGEGYKNFEYKVLEYLTENTIFNDRRINIYGGSKGYYANM